MAEKRTRLTKDAISIIETAEKIQFVELNNQTMLRFEDKKGNSGYILSVDGSPHIVEDRKKTIRAIKRIRNDVVISELKPTIYDESQVVRDSYMDELIKDAKTNSYTNKF